MKYSTLLLNFCIFHNTNVVFLKRIFPILCFAGSFPGAEAKGLKGDPLSAKYDHLQPLGEMISYYNGTAGNML